MCRASTTTPMPPRPRLRSTRYLLARMVPGAASGAGGGIDKGDADDHISGIARQASRTGRLLAGHVDLAHPARALAVHRAGEPRGHLAVAGAVARVGDAAL